MFGPLECRTLLEIRKPLYYWELSVENSLVWTLIEGNLYIDFEPIETLSFISSSFDKHPLYLGFAKIVCDLPTLRQTGTFFFIKAPQQSRQTGYCLLGTVSQKKVAVLLDFVHFSQTVYIGSIWGWGGRGRPQPNFFGIWHSKKW